MRFFVGYNDEDITLLVRLPDGRWRCNDDNGMPDWGQPLSPNIQMTEPATGQYSVWVGTWREGIESRATLQITESRANHP